MAELVVTQDELALRRRARRRLVGAVAIALTVVVALPMLLDSEPKPLGPEVDIRIPAQDTPFDTPPAGAVSVPAEPAAKAAEPTPMPAPSSSSSPVEAAAKTASQPVNELAKPAPASKPESAPAKVELKSPAPAKPAAEKGKPEPKPEAKPPLKPDSQFSSQGYFLQLGAFTSETNARQLQEKAAAAGFKATLNESSGQYRVRVGPMPQHERAMEMQAKLKAKGFSPILLGP